MVTNYINNLKLKDKIVEVRDTDNEKTSPEASVIIVTYNTEKELLSQNLDSLNKQTSKDFEIIIVDNSDKTDVKSIMPSYSLKYIKLNKNYGLSLARNIGTKYARGVIVIFLDDDAIPANDFVEKHINAYKEHNIFGLRGKALPRTTTIYNYFVSHYDYGDQTIPCFINLEGNSSFKKDILIEVGGFNPAIQGAGGGEGLELTHRIINKCKDKSKLIYYPNAIIYHDYSHTFIKYIKKGLRYAQCRDIVECQFADIFEIVGGYELSPKKLKKDSPSLFFRVKMIMISKFVSFILKVQKLLSILSHGRKG